MYISQVKCIELTIRSFYETSIFLKKIHANLIRVSETWKEIVEIILFSVHFERLTWVNLKLWKDLI